ncbi:MAG: pimeloyl-ACP methyl ester carboxylesterase [Candidatus Azotimanducaceae bacterium]|jgi:pimeloyl-ACP methyl ester carboxylesterase
MTDTPDWFWSAIEVESTARKVEIAGSDVSYLSWSEPGNPGLLFVHGHNAHAHWWDFVAPSFKDNYQVAAVDLSGMGDSDHRDNYSGATYAEEIIGVADVLNMPSNTIVVAHSFGGIMALRTLATDTERFKGLVLVDSGVRHPDEVRDPDRDITRLARPKLYPSREVAMSRFRLQPPQQCANQYVVDHIARNSVEFDGEGWVWKFDEELNTRMTGDMDSAADLALITARLALIYGEQSESFSAKSAAYMQSLNQHLQVSSIADAQHHLFLDQPLAFIQELRNVLDGWQ